MTLTPWSSRPRIALLAGALGALFVAAMPLAARAQVDFGRVNDYYAARGSADGSNRVAVVEQYHLPPGEQALRARNYAKAFSEFAFILNIFPNHPRALAQMLQVCEQWKSPHCRSEDLLAKAVSVNPNAAGTYVVRGTFFHRERQYPKAVESYKRALEIDSASLNAHYNLGLTYLEMKDYARANEHAQQAYALGAPFPGLRKGLERVGGWKPLEQRPASDSPSTTPEAKPAASPEPKQADDRAGEAAKD
jgi:tetratricopeptide (TPR) repeat protein